MCDMRRRLTYSMSCGHSFLVFTERCQYDCKDPLIEDHEDAIQGEAPCAKCVADIKVKGMRQAYDMERLGKEAELQQLHKLLVTLREKDPEVRCSAQIAEIELKLELMRSSIDQESRKHNREIIEAKRAGRAAVQPQEFQVLEGIPVSIPEHITRPPSHERDTLSSHSSKLAPYSGSTRGSETDRSWTPTSGSLSTHEDSNETSTDDSDNEDDDATPTNGMPRVRSWRSRVSEEQRRQIHHEMNHFTFHRRCSAVE